MSNSKLELTWIGKDKQFKIEPRILIEDKEKSYGDKNTGNMLIHGDNLLALKALEDKFTNKIKCIYIDPPYNISTANPYYSDYIPISDWLSLMKPRLEILNRLLSDEGTIFVQIDKELSAHLKILMDEVFGPSKYITTIAVRMSGTSGFKIEHSDKTIVKNVEYIHVYSKNLNIKPVYEKANYDSHYSYIIKPYKSKYKISNLIKEKYVADLLKKYNLKEKNDNLVILYNISEEFKKFVFENKENIGRTHTAPKIKDEEKIFLNNELTNNDEVIKRKYGRNEYYIKKNSGGFCQFIPISLKFNYVDSYDGYNLELSNILGDWWDGFYLDMGNVENEGNVEFKASKKPERLLFRILNMCTNEGDYILDSFLGSGTTCAVANKMNRKWIGIEMGEHCYTHCIPRINSIIEGKDKTGITKFVNWQGGGGYKFYELAPSLLVKDKFNNWVISENFNGDLLIRAICKQEKFDYSPDNNYYWKQGKSSENDYIYVTTNYISLEYLQNIKEEMKDDESLLICCKAYQEECKDKYDNITIKKIPQSILNNCEYGRDDYSLNIEEVLEGQEHE